MTDANALDEKTGKADVAYRAPSSTLPLGDRIFSEAVHQAAGIPQMPQFGTSAAPIVTRNGRQFPIVRPNHVRGIVCSYLSHRLQLS